MSARRGSTGLTAGGVKKALAKQQDSEFNTVARIVFGTAKRAGVAVSKDERVSAEDDYVKQLLRFQQHSKKKGGSLSRLSLNVASVMAKTAAEDSDGAGPLPEGKKVSPMKHVKEVPRNIRTSAQAVPSLRIPSVSEGGRQSAATLAALKKAGLLSQAQQPIVGGSSSLDLKLPAGVVGSMRSHKEPILEPREGEAERLELRKQALMMAAATQEAKTQDSFSSPAPAAVELSNQETPKKQSIFQKLKLDIAPETAPSVSSGASALQQQLEVDSEPPTMPTVTSTQQQQPAKAAPAPAMATAIPQPRVKVATGKAAIATPAAVEPTPSVSVKPVAQAATSAADWMAQREREFEETREKERKEAEAAKEQALIDERNLAATKWVLERSEHSVGYFEPRNAIKNYEVVKEIFFQHNQDWEGALTKLGSLAEEANTESKTKVSDNVVSLAAHTVARVAHANTSSTVLEDLRALCAEHKISRNVINDAEIMIASKNHDQEGIVKLYEGLKGPEFVKLTKPSLYSLIIANTSLGGWRKGLDALEHIKGHVSDSYCMLELAMVRSLTATGGLMFERRAALDWLERTIRERMGDLGKLHAIHLILARCALRNFDTAKTIVHEFERRNEADEGLYGALISTRSEEQRDNVEKMMLESTFPDTDPVFLSRKIAALAKQPFKVREGETQEPANVDGAFTLLVRWKEGEIPDAKTGAPVPFQWNITLLNTVFGMLEHSGDSSLIDMCLAGMEELEAIYKMRRRDRGLLYMAFVSEERYDDLIHFQEVRCPLGARETFTFDGEKNYNIALKATDREPYSSLTEDDRERVEGKGGQRGQGQGSTGGTLVIPDSEKMLQLSLDKKWQEALTVLGQARIPQGVTMTEEEANKLTIVYNAGINVSQAVGLSAVERVYQAMLSNGVRTNATTHNTLMSMYSHAPTAPTTEGDQSATEPQWLKALTEFQTMESSKKDVSSYSILLSLLSKRNLWEEAVVLMAQLKASPTVTPNPVVYSLIINAVYKQSWAVALSSLKDLHRSHGADNIKEKTKAKVVRALETAGKQDLVAKMNAMLAGKQKGSGKGEKKSKKKEAATTDKKPPQEEGGGARTSPSAGDAVPSSPSSD